MKYFFILLLTTAFLSSCETDEGKLPEIEFETGNGYVSTDTTLLPNTSFSIGIHASKTESKDVLKKFNISRSIQQGPLESIYSQNLSGSDGDHFHYVYTATTSGTSGQSTVYTFTITNRDGLINQLNLKILVQ
ncbi:MAG: hypothetical protein K1X68_13915 [Saprospiraceae bacterium]|nr:hypothetical protein [Saprospiraceae bacterium]HMW38889.1 hypothetical protein [Saprospiraceae bacterium]HMX86951.1 hypothetical protein [Saprospiraceae bacterium]HMZ39870.1 hypothetical protein [Saprospiraceae bacterium]HNA65890.1 hypothetical protein [Saprospiraceae bacterium]